MARRPCAPTSAAGTRSACRSSSASCATRTSTPSSRPCCRRSRRSSRRRHSDRARMPAEELAERVQSVRAGLDGGDAPVRAIAEPPTRLPPRSPRRGHRLRRRLDLPRRRRPRRAEAACYPARDDPCRRCCRVARRVRIVVCGPARVVAGHGAARRPPPRRAGHAAARERHSGAPRSAQLRSRCRSRSCPDRSFRLHRAGGWSPPGESDKFFADQIDLYADTNRIAASGNVVLHRRPKGTISAERVEFNVADRHRHLPRRATASCRSGRLRQSDTVRRRRPRRLLRRRDDREARRPPLPHHQRRLHHLRAADAALATGQRQRPDQPRRLRHRAQHRAARQGRAGDLPAGLYYPIQDDDRATGFLLPTYGTVDGCAARPSATRSSGRSAAATTPRSSTTGSPRPGQGAGAEYRYIAGTAVARQPPLLPLQPAERDLRDRRRRRTTVLPAEPRFELTAAATIRSRRPIARPGAGRLLLGHRQPAAVSAERLPGDAAQPCHRGRGDRRGSGALSHEHHVSAQRAAQQHRPTARSTAARRRVTATLAPQRLFSSPIYGSVNAEYAYLPYRDLNGEIVTRTTASVGSTSRRRSACRCRACPSSSVNTSATYRATYYSRQGPGRPSGRSMAPTCATTSRCARRSSARCSPGSGTCQTAASPNG